MYVTVDAAYSTVYRHGNISPELISSIHQWTSYLSFVCMLMF